MAARATRRFYSVTKPLYDHTASMLYQDLNVGFEVPDAVVVEDSKSGYQFYDALCNRLGIPCYTATGVANLKRTIHECPEQNILAIGDGAAFGPYIEKGARTARLQERTLVPPRIIRVDTPAIWPHSQ